MTSDSAKQVSIRLLTSEVKYSLPSTTLSVPEDVDTKGLNNLVHQLLKENDDFDGQTLVIKD